MPGRKSKYTRKDLSLNQITLTPDLRAWLRRNRNDARILCEKAVKLQRQVNRLHLKVYRILNSTIESLHKKQMILIVEREGEK